MTSEGTPDVDRSAVRDGHAASYYAATAHPHPVRPPLEGSASADVCVIGAGFSGISTALHLAEKGYRVTVLEAVRIGYGASGRNGGQIINGYSRDYDTIRARYGEDTARALLHMSFEGGDIIRDRIARHDIDCDLQPGAFFAAFNDRQLRALERRRLVWGSAGHTQLESIDRRRLPEITDAPLYVGGLLDHRGGHLHPLNLLLGQARALEAHGGSVHEQSRVTRIEAGQHPAAVTEDGRLTARTLVLCGNAYLGDAVPALSSRYMPVSSQIVTTEVLGEGLARRMLPGGHCVEDCNYLLDYYRMTADHRLLFGGGVVYSGATPRDIVRRLQPHVVRTFPYLKGRRFDFAWSGRFALTLTRMPHIGRLDHNIYFIHGDSGHGVTTCHLLGRLVAEAIAGQTGRFDVFSSMRNLPFPGGRLFRVPLTALGAWYYGLREKLGI